MIQNVLILGASGAVGSLLFARLSRCADLRVFGTYHSRPPGHSASFLPFSVKCPEDILPILEQIRPQVVISALRGDFEGQLAAHAFLARYLAQHGGRLLYLSTSNVFDGQLDRPHCEADVPVPQSDYGRFKSRCEALLQAHLGQQAVLLRLPFVWGKSSPRMQAVRAGCRAGQLEIYAELWCNHAADLQVADWVQWVMQANKTGIFHIGTDEVQLYSVFIQELISAAQLPMPRFIPQSAPGIRALASSRTDIPDRLKWNSARLIRYLCQP